MIDSNNLASGLAHIDPALLKAQVAQRDAAVWNEGYVTRRQGLPRAAPAFIDPRMTEQWLDGYDCAAATYPLRVDQSVPSEAVTC